MLPVSQSRGHLLGMMLDAPGIFENNTIPANDDEWDLVNRRIAESSASRGRDVRRDLGTYDLWGFMLGNEDSGGHGPDTYKKPGHPSFSTDSKYSTPETPGGVWSGTDDAPVFTPSEWMVEGGPMSLEAIREYYRWLNSQPGEVPVKIVDPRR